MLFGLTAQMLGTRQIEFDLSGSATVSEILGHLTAENPSLAGHSLRLAINQQYATGRETVRDGDELAIFTAVSGG